MIAEFVFRGPATRLRREVLLMTARIQLLLIVLGMIVVAALNASSPWGP
jgi:hypothetical protein